MTGNKPFVLMLLGLVEHLEGDATGMQEVRSLVRVLGAWMKDRVERRVAFMAYGTATDATVQIADVACAFARIARCLETAQAPESLTRDVMQLSRTSDGRIFCQFFYEIAAHDFGG